MRSAPRCTKSIVYARRRQLHLRHLRRLSGADHDRSAGAADPASRDALAVHAARRQGGGRGQLHEHAGLHRQRGRGCARRRRARPAADAGQARGAHHHEARAVRLSARRDACGGARGARRRRQRRRRDRGRAVAGAAAVDAHGAAEAGGRHHARRGPVAASRSKTMRSASAPRCARPNCWRGRNSPQRQPLLAQALPWVGHCADARARHGVRLDRARRSERRAAALPRGARRERCPFVGVRAPQRRGGRLLHRADVDRAPRRRADRSRVVSLRAGRRPVTRSASSRAGTATSPSWPARRWRRRPASGSRSAAWRTGR